MKITAKDVKLVTENVTNVTIELTEMEAGYLRAICYGSCRGRLDASFASKMFQELDRYRFVSYDRNHPNWKVTKRARENW